MAGKTLITRPEEDAKPLADALAARGAATLIEPLLSIRTLPDTAAALAEDLAGVQALLFTSANGVRAFADLSSRRDIGVLAVGDATAASARAAGFKSVESAGGDVNALADLAKRRLKPEAGPLFHAAGSAVAGDLTRLLGESGFILRRRMLYESQPATTFTPEARAALLTGEIDQVVLFSPRTAATFANLANAASVDCRRMAALCLSPAVAEMVRGLSWRAIQTATRPDLPSMLALIDREIAHREPIRAIPEPGPEPEARAAMTNTPPSSLPPQPSPRSSVPPSSSALPPAAKTPARRAGGVAIFMAGLVGALIAGAVVLGVIHYAPEQLGLAGSQGEADSKAVAALSQQLADVSTRLAELQQQVTALPRPPADIGQVSDRIAALQGELAALKSAGAAGASPVPAEITGLPQRLADLEMRVAELKPADLAGIAARLSALEQRPAGSAGDAAAMEKMRTDLAEFDARLKAAEAAAADLAGMKQGLAQLAAASGKSGDGAAGIALSINALQRLIAGGKPYGAAIAALESFAGGDPGLAATIAPSLAGLKADADKGVATLSELQGSFPTAAEAIARAASAAEANASPDASFGERVLARLSSLVSVRPVGGGTQGDDPMARLARAEAKLNAGDIEGAASELSGLPAGPVAEAAKPWLTRVQARLAVDAALDRLEGDVIAALAKSAGGTQ